jgi:uncharacterized protein
MTAVRRGLFAAALALVAVAASSAPRTSEAQSPLVLGTASVGGTYNIYGDVVARILTDRARLQIVPQQTQGPNQNVILIDDGKIGLGMTTMGVALQALQGSAPWTKGKKYESIRALFPMYDTPMQCVSLAKTGITRFDQLAGKTVGTGPKAGTAGTYFPMIFDALGMKVSVRNGQSADMGNQLKDGLLDAFCFGAGAPVPAFTELDAEQKVAFYTWTPEEIAKIRKAMMEFTESTIPKGTYTQQTADQKTVGLFNFAIAHKDMPDDLAYLITKTVLENNGPLIKAHPAARDTLAANAARNTFLPFHPGAVRYYKEKGIKLDPATIPK